MKLIEKTCRGKNNRINAALISMDQSSAFDVIPHKWLKEKMIHIGIHQNSINTIMSYLSERKQAVYINGNTSDTLLTGPYSVSQGSILSGNFYLIYTLDMTLQTHIKEYINININENNDYLK